ncbi:PD-(D/E)XK nuclease family protein [Candidatus Pacearchaeota archaeon]|nr:PD-(D/E)XK nuclease family protein [Candidatus Pacearchaeota archaeon]
MSKFYSYSRLETFEKCPLKFKFKYIDKIIPEVEKTIEAHLGKLVHSALEWLYKEVKNKKTPSIDELIKFYVSEWEKEFTPKIIVVRKEMTFGDYLNKGVEFLAAYYLKNKPFDDNTIEVEKQINLSLDDEGKYKIRGFIDRLTYNLSTGEYEIHDYKTANSPSIESLKNDRQLSLYSLAIKELFGKDKEVRMVWHFLALNKKFHIKKTNEELTALKEEVKRLVEKIEATNDFPPKKSALCSWCEYKSICPAWGNAPPKIEKQKSLEEIKEENSKPLDIWG